MRVVWGGGWVRGAYIILPLVSTFSTCREPWTKGKMTWKKIAFLENPSSNTSHDIWGGSVHAKRSKLNPYLCFLLMLTLHVTPRCQTLAPYSSVPSHSCLLFGAYFSAFAPWPLILRVTQIHYSTRKHCQCEDTKNGRALGQLCVSLWLDVPHSGFSTLEPNCFPGFWTRLAPSPVNCHYGGP